MLVFNIQDAFFKNSRSKMVCDSKFNKIKSSSSEFPIDVCHIFDTSLSLILEKY